MIELLLTFTIGCLLGWKICDIWTRVMIKELLEDMGLTDQQQKLLREKCVTELRSAGLEVEDDESEIPEIEVTLEQHQGVIFAYSKDDGSFMAQGKTRDELFNALRARYKEIRCVVAAENGAELLRKSHT